MPTVELNEFEYALIIQLREEAERVTKDLPENQKAEALDSYYKRRSWELNNRVPIAHWR
jgi:hypothetical protein